MTATPEFVDRRLSERGLPTGGTTGLVLAKASEVDYAATWQDTASTIADGTITTAKIADNAITNAKIAANAVGTSQIFLEAVVPAKIAPGTSAQVLMSNATPATAWTTLSGDVTVNATGATTIANNAVTNAKILNDAVSAAKIQQGTAGQVLLTNNTPDTAWVTLTGDVTVDGTGATAIGTGVIVAADLSTATGAPAGPWNTDTTIVGFTNVTGGSLVRRWLIIGKTMHFRVWFNAGTATALGSVAFTLPGGVTSGPTRAQPIHCVNTATIVSAVVAAAGTTCTLYATNAAGAFAAGATLVNLTAQGTIELT